jgi:exosortase/archaeosortase family protein
MKIIGEIKKSYQSIPAEVKIFLKRALLVFIIWKLIYGFILFPLKFPDKQLTEFTAYGTAKMVGVFYPNWNFSFKEEVDPILKNYFVKIYANQKPIVGIADPCNALELYVLYIGFLICLPTTVKRFIVFTIVGIALISILNILRCGGIALLNIHNNHVSEIAHHYVFKIIMYGLIFYGWILYSKKYVIDEEK